MNKLKLFLLLGLTIITVPLVILHTPKYEAKLIINSYYKASQVFSYKKRVDKDTMQQEMKIIEEISASQNTARDISSGTFPSSYATVIAPLQSEHPNWVFVPVEIGKDHFTFTQLNYNSKSQYGVTRDSVNRYTNPLNLLEGADIIQFLDFTSIDSNVLVNVEKITTRDVFFDHSLGPYFLEGTTNIGMNTCLMLGHMIEESGWGGSRYSRGNTYNGQTVYNFYGIGAFDSNPDNAIRYAYDQGWFTPSLGISGGADWIKRNYVERGQDTLYAMNWNIQDYITNGTVNHWYASTAESSTNKANIASRGLMDCEQQLIFKIPVFTDLQ